MVRVPVCLMLVTIITYICSCHQIECDEGAAVKCESTGKKIRGCYCKTAETRDGPYVETISDDDGGGYRVDGRYCDGVLCGEERRWWKDTGKLAWIGFWRGGRKEGAWMMWAPDGKPRLQRTYVDGLVDGVVVFFDERGLVAGTQSYRAGHISGIQQNFDRSGACVAAWMWDTPTEKRRIPCPVPAVTRILESLPPP